MQISIKNHPPILNDKELIVAFDNKIPKQHEFVIGTRLVLQRPLFGRCYEIFDPGYFRSMPNPSGVMISLFMPTKSLSPSINFPGDIDMLVIPYEGNNLLLSKTMVIEIKVVRAKFSKQGKSPNEFGFSQAKGLLDLGFPYVGLAHLIISDESPPESFRKVKIAQITDEESQAAELVGEAMADLMPMDLIKRSYGRLVKNCTMPSLGLLSAYIQENNQGYWSPRGNPCIRNPKTDPNLLSKLGEYYQANVHRFINTPRYPITSTSDENKDCKATSTEFELSRMHEEGPSMFLKSKIIQDNV